MRARLITAPLAVLLALAATSSYAKTAPLIEDPKGDYPVPAGDIVSADIVTTKKGKGALQITMTLAAAPTTTTPYSYSVNFTAGDCDFGAVLYNHPFAGVFSGSGVGCREAGSTSLPEGNVKVAGDTITWTVPLSGALKKGVLLTDIAAGTAPTGMVSGGIIEALGDGATTERTYKIGS